MDISQNTQHVITFGKHAGKTLEQIFEEAPGYIRWFAENFTVKPYARMKEETVARNRALLVEALRLLKLEKARREANMAAQEIKNREESTSEFIGEIKKRDTFTGTIVKENRSGSTEVEIDGNIALVYVSGDIGETFTFKGTPIRHFEHMGIKKTYMNRIAIIS